MPSQINLIYTDDGGEPRRIALRSPRLSVGRGADNDLCINDTNLSRRHAIVEVIAGRPYISDCGSSNGTTVNGQTVTSAIELYDGDRINLGNSRELIVAIEEATAATDDAVAASATPDANAQAGSPEAGQVSGPAAPASPHAPPAGSASEKVAATALRAPILAGAAIGVILLGALVLFVYSLGGDDKKTRGGDGRAGASNTGVERANATGGRTPGGNAGPRETPRAETNASVNAQASEVASGTPSAATAGDNTDEQIGREVRRAMGRISSDNAPYISETGAADVARKVREYRGSAALAERLRALARGCADVTTLARTNNLKPSLLSYAALAQAESAGGGDPVAVARQMSPKLLTLRATFGTETANSSLLLVAAYPYPFNPSIGSQERTPHPLASKLMEVGGRRSVVETSVARSVWFLREKNAVSAEAYDLVVRLLAVGVIAQNPRQYGVEADPVFC
ncbi:MAG TPA: FHA domain-containing protein [Pyrinomonadaceae bacterium]